MSASQKRKPPIDVNAIPSGVLVRKDVVLAYCGVSATTIWAWLKDGKFPQPTRRVGRIPFWSIDDVRAFARGEWKPEDSKSSAWVVA